MEKTSAYFQTFEWQYETNPSKSYKLEQTDDAQATLYRYPPKDWEEVTIVALKNITLTPKKGLQGNPFPVRSFADFNAKMIDGILMPFREKQKKIQVNLKDNMINFML